MIKKNTQVNFRLDKGQIESPDEVMVEIYKKKSPQERIKIASDMWESARQQIFSVIRSLHPDWQTEQINKETIKRLAHENL
jgi:hypothetical protein